MDMFFFCTCQDCSQPNCLYHEPVVAEDFVDVGLLRTSCAPVETAEIHVFRDRVRDEDSVDFPWETESGDSYELVPTHAFRKVSCSGGTYYWEPIPEVQFRKLRGTWTLIHVFGRDYYSSSDVEYLEETR